MHHASGSVCPEAEWTGAVRAEIFALRMSGARVDRAKRASEQAQSGLNEAKTAHVIGIVLMKIMHHT